MNIKFKELREWFGVFSYVCAPVMVNFAMCNTVGL